MHDCLLGYTHSSSSISLKVTENQRLNAAKIMYSKLNYTARSIYCLIQIKKTTKVLVYKIYLRVINRLPSIFKYSGSFQQGFRSIISNREVKSFTKANLKYSNKVRKILKRNNPFYDKYLLKRNPPLHFEQKSGRQVVQLDSNYMPDNEIRTDNKPYEALYNSLFTLNEFRQIKSFIDIGCSSGNLVDLVSTNFPRIECAGIETFAFLKNASSLNVIEKIFLEDLRFPLMNKYSKFELAVCLEVGEHILLII